MKAIINGKIIHNRKMLTDQILLFDEEIISISKNTPPAGCEVIDAQGLYVSAGFVDIHIHGSGGADVMDATFEALDAISLAILPSGTTSWVATTMTMSQDKIINALGNIVTHKEDVRGAKIRGVHLEGPFLNPSKSGAQDANFIQKPNLELIAPFAEHIRLITIAPEMSGAEEFIKKIKELYPHIVLSIGHSEANYEEAVRSFDWGVLHATHLFNAMPPWHHRAPGIIGAVFDSEVTADVIADLIHTHPSILKSVVKLKKERLILISDAMRAGCMREGRYELGGQTVNVSNNRATLTNGVLAGSVLRLNDAVHNILSHTEASLIEAIEMVTKLPARLLKIPAGELLLGYDADIVLFDENISIKSVYMNGLLKYQV